MFSQLQASINNLPGRLRLATQESRDNHTFLLAWIFLSFYRSMTHVNFSSWRWENAIILPIQIFSHSAVFGRHLPKARLFDMENSFYHMSDNTKTNYTLVVIGPIQRDMFRVR